jgi:hypothetical protein
MRDAVTLQAVEPLFKKATDFLTAAQAAAELIAALADRPEALVRLGRLAGFSGGVALVGPGLTVKARVLEDALDSVTPLLPDLIEALADILGPDAVRAATCRILSAGEAQP